MCVCRSGVCFFFFQHKTAYEVRISEWSSDVCSSDLGWPGDFVLITVRGDSMEPDFRHGDQLLCDKRDRSPAQPGPFAIWDGEWGEYVLKNVEIGRAHV